MCFSFIVLLRQREFLEYFVVMRRKLNYLDLFAGAGGLSEGFIRGGSFLLGKKENRQVFIRI